jgi:UDP-N-acetylmuramoyl-tripeptide--D-alanyl-D-alanine ligase
MKIKEILKVTRGKLVSGDPGTDIDLAKICTDSRAIGKGEFFLALKGPNFDGADFLEEVFKKGATGAIITKRPGQRPVFGKILIQVEDTTKALQHIARHHRMKFNIPVIGVTGSSGKTTVKEMIWTALSSKYNVLKNEGTKNNHIGVPQTLLKLNSCHDICVLELGTNHRGEIRLLSKIARPTAAVITVIGPSHLEFLNDLEGVFEAKKEILEHLADDGLLALNGDDEFLTRIKNARFNIKRFGLEPANDYRATRLAVKNGRIKFLVNGKDRFELKLLGSHNVYNALAAIAVASHFGVGYALLKKSLAAHKPSHLRLNLDRVNGIDVINDSYNSNPLSMKFALEALKIYPANAKWVVSGDMLELGKKSRHFHEALGSLIADCGAMGLLALGKYSKFTVSQAKKDGMESSRVWHCKDHDEIAGILRRVARKGDAILIKGSRGMKLEKVVEKLGKGK